MMIPDDQDVRDMALRRPFLIRGGRRIRAGLDSVIALFSKVPNDPVLDPRIFAWTARLRADWPAIREEALTMLQWPERVPLLDEISPDHKDIAPPGKWRSFFLMGYGTNVPRNMARCPATVRAIAGIPELNSAFFSILAPGAHITAHRGVTKGLMTCHLGLIVPEGPIQMRIADKTVHWREGETLVFDDTWDHEVWNETDEARVVLLIQFGRPLRAPGRWLAHAFLYAIRNLTPFVREARDNLDRWDAAFRPLDKAPELEDAA